jgi:hypothetical protein
MAKRKFQIGDICVTNTVFGSIQPGTVCKVTNYNSASAYGTGDYEIIAIDSGEIKWVKPAMIDHYSKHNTNSVERFQQNIEGKQKEIAKLQSEISDMEDKISYLNDNGIDTYNENEYKAYKTLLIIEKGNMSRIEKAKAIASLITK